MAEEKIREILGERVWGLIPDPKGGLTIERERVARMVHCGATPVYSAWKIRKEYKAFAIFKNL